MKLFILSIFLFIPLLGQQQPPVTPTPPCVIPFFMFQGGGGAQLPIPSVTGFDNRQSGCSNWNLTYTSTGYSAITLAVETAPTLDNTPPGTPGTYVNFAGTIVTGINPNTAITQASTTFSGYFPWIRVHLTASTTASVGNIVGVLIGTVPISASGGSVTAGCPNPCPVVGAAADGSPASGNPVLIAGLDGSGNANTLRTGNAQADSVNGSHNLAIVPYIWNGSSWDRQFYCSNSTPISLAASGLAQIIALSGTTQIRVCNINLSTAVAMTEIDITSGTGVNCAAATVVQDSYMNVTGFINNYSSFGSLILPAGSALCVNPSGAGALKGSIQWARF